MLNLFFSLLFDAILCQTTPLLVTAVPLLITAMPLRRYAVQCLSQSMPFLCMTPPICALLCLCLSLRVKTSPNLCLSKLSLASPLPIKTVLYMPSPSYAIFCQAFAWLCGALAIRCLSTLGRCFAVQINTFAFRSRSQVRFAVANAIHSKSVALQV